MDNITDETLKHLPDGCVLGLNYSGMHDSAIAIVAPDGTPLYAVSLERLSRVKQDGRPPDLLLQSMPWEKIALVALTTPREFHAPEHAQSSLHPLPLKKPRSQPAVHAPAFLEIIDHIPGKKLFVGHQEAHAASAFWGSGFDEALCLTYDGGMCNDPWFGGLYRCSRSEGIAPLDRFSAMHYAKITSLYTFVTALLGFSPNKHEGKITGLAACGQPDAKASTLLARWFEEEYFELEACMRWAFAYNSAQPPELIASNARIARFREESGHISREDMAASMQDYAERHIADILQKARAKGWHGPNICLAGGLFANVKINQRIAESGFDQLFVAPPMTDDGTALGAAWQALATTPSFNPSRLSSMFLGPRYTPANIEDNLGREQIFYSRPSHPAEEIARLLAQGSLVAVFQGACEFGPRALGNRSILAQASDADINQSLNQRLNRTEFMPFAPVTRAEDADQCYLDIDRVRHAAEFMTVTVQCTPYLQETCPAVVHIDGTARPQIVTAQSNPLIHAILTEYRKITGRPALVNTSFNIHEEPIVCSPQDALRGFFESGLDYLYMEGGGLIAYADNSSAALRFMRQKLSAPGQRSRQQSAINLLLDSERHKLERQIHAKEEMIQQLSRMDLHRQLEEKEAVIQQMLNSPFWFGAVRLKKQIGRSGECPQQAKLADDERRQLIENFNESLAQQQKLKHSLAQLARENDYFVQQIETLTKENAHLHAQLHQAPTSSEMDSDALHSQNHNDERPNPAALPGRFLPTSSAIALLLHGYRQIRHFKRAAQHRTWQILRPRLGHLCQHAPRALVMPPEYHAPVALSASPKISIVTPSFRHACFIERTLDSVLDQRYPNLEYIVQDGGSDDGTKDILQRYSGRLARWESAPDGGQSNALNKGFVHSAGEIMAWLNSDDILLPGALAYVAEYFNTHPEVDVVYGHRFLIDENDQLIGRWMLPRHSDAVLSWADYIPQETLFWRRHIWDKAGGRIDESFRFAMDWDLLLRFRAAGATFARLPRFIGAFRIHAHQKTSAIISDIGFREMDRIRQRELGYVPACAEIRKAILTYMVRHAMTDLCWRLCNKWRMPS